MKKAIVIGVILLFLGVGFQPALAVNQNETTNIILEEVNNQEEVKPISFCILLVYTHVWSPVGPGTKPFVWLRCEDLATGGTRYGITGLLGLKIFIGLQRGHTYEIYARHYGASQVIELSYFFNDMWLCVEYVP